MEATVVTPTPIWTLGERMWKARKDRGLEQSDVAKAVGVSRALVSRWERDQSEPGIHQLRKFATELSVDWSWLTDNRSNSCELEWAGSGPSPQYTQLRLNHLLALR